MPNPQLEEELETQNLHLMETMKRFKRVRLVEPSFGVIGFFILAVCVIFCLFYLDYREVVSGFRFSFQSERFQWLWVDGYPGLDTKVEFLSEMGRGCDVFDGDWVWDESYPLYKSTDCWLLDGGFRCSESGRPDDFYTKWRWQPKHCNLPRFDAKMMLEKLRNKRVVFVGDSIGRNQWESLLCMLATAVSDQKKIYEVNGNPITKHKGYLIFKFEDYNLTVEYYRAPFLVPQGRPPAGVSKSVRSTLKLDRMDWSSAKWKESDVLILNTGHWWNYEKTLRGGCYFQDGLQVSLNMSVDDAYQRALRTVFDWIDKEVNTSKTQVFFRTYSPVHFRGGDWRSGGACHTETLPELEESTSVSPKTWPKLTIATKLLSARQIVREIDVLNITILSHKRKDGHSSLYYLGPGMSPASIHRQDCSHWCLPGVPDSWNELLHALFLRRESRNSQAWNSFL